MFANCSLSGMNFAMPDVCLTPIPTPAGPIPTPIPYPNMALLPTALPPTCSLTNLIMMMPAHNLMTTIPLSNGDQPGCMPGGVASAMIMGPSRNLLGSFKTLYGGMPATRSFIDITMQNMTNCPGLGRNMLPSQFKVLIMS
jgi:hypothetical protein